MHTACVWSEKLPFAGYSVVKEPAFALRALARQAVDHVEQLIQFCLARQAEARVASRRAGVSGAKAGGEYRARTGDLLVANQALSQLS